MENWNDKAFNAPPPSRASKLRFLTIYVGKVLATTRSLLCE
jgi:hypothetical protein